MTPKLGVTFSCQNFLTPSFGDPKLKHCVLASRVSIPTPLSGGRDARGAGRSRGEGTVGCCAYACESSLSVRSRWAGGAVARTGQSSSRRRVLRPWPVWGQRRGIAAGEPRGCGRPPWVGSARYVKLLAAKLAHTGELLFARRAVESHGLGVIR